MRIDQQVTRQELAALTGLRDDVLAFWIKNGLLVAASGGEGKGSHRRFDGFQVTIAANLGELRKFGINLTGLRAFAAQLQYATRLGKSAPCNPFAFYDAMELRMKLDRFAAGEAVEVGDGVEGWRPATTEQEICEHIASWPGDLHDKFENVLACARAIGPEDFAALRLFLDAHSEAYRLVRADGRIADWGESAWLMVRADDDTWAIYSSPPGHDPLPSHLGTDDVPSGIYLMPAVIFRRTWGDRISHTLVDDPQETEENKAIRAKLRSVDAERQREHERRIANALLAREERLAADDREAATG